MFSRTQLLPFRRQISRIKGTQSLDLSVQHPRSLSVVPSSQFSQTATPCSEKSSSPTHEPNEGKDAFSDLNVLAKARKRWGLEATSFTPIVFPGGRPEIMERTQKLKEDRISSGMYATRAARNDLREKDAKEMLNIKTSVKSQWINPQFHLSPRDPEDVAPTPQWKKHKMTIKDKLLGKAWNPQKKLSRQAMDEVRYLRKQFPDEWTTPKLAEHFNVASESIARILGSNFQPSAERAQEQDLVRQSARKANIERHREQIMAGKSNTYTRSATKRVRERVDMPPKKAEVERPSEKDVAARHAAWLKQKTERDQTRQQSRIAPAKLGAPKRSIGGE
ncbi:Required for respiratory growth protein 9 mitochondrial [Lunasporangiospora selenospora]|uniref:Required for respiratory growth protein 9, mitochondrial n=1 Tax=Lunasporangiospora selenospora TaxID=979761 RepID=A0A9P6G2W8_9FUNG|nr:Required for respiratory growth protein 9 mitochondrial [Lunasporangiospora selenospora]